MSNTYNSRLQLITLSVQAPVPTGTVFSRTFTYGPTLQNNGNISAITDNLVSDRSAVYTYDQLNRIASAQSTGTSCLPVPTNPALTQNWGNTYTIDAWGNLTAKTVTKCSSEALSTTVNLKNQLGVGTHDAAGNLLNNGPASYTYDAENRIVSTAGATYVYDGDGVRVKKSGGAAAPTLYWGESFTDGPVTETDLSGTIKAEYVYFGGKRIARRDWPNGLTNPAAVHYYFADHLKSVNLVYDAAGNKEEDSDFYPYGGERGYVLGSGNHFKFTGKERDPESGLDYFGARYYGNSLGRFLTPDHPFADQNIENPQSWNLYAYVRDNPLDLTDDSGAFSGTVHDQITRTVASAAGFSSAAIDVLSAGNLYVDRPSNFFNNPEHGMTNITDSTAEGKAKIKAVLDNRIDSALDLAISGKYYDALFVLGEGTHTFQDFAAHGGIQMIDHPSEAANDKDRVKVQKASDNTKYYFNYFKERLEALVGKKKAEEILKKLNQPEPKKKKKKPSKLNNTGDKDSSSGKGTVNAKDQVSPNE